MKRRRKLGPKKQKNRPALIRFLLYALGAATLGGALTYLLYHLIGPRPTDAENFSWRHSLPGMLATLTLLAVLALIFFGVRAYLTGTKVRHSLASTRLKIKRP